MTRVHVIRCGGLLTTGKSRRRRWARTAGVAVILGTLPPAAAVQPTTPAEDTAGGTPPPDVGVPDPAAGVSPPLSAESFQLDARPPTGIEEELRQIRPGLALKRRFDELAAASGLRLAVANTYLLQQATGGPGRRTAASGDLDLLAKWTAIGLGTKDTGLLALSTEYRYQIGDQPPSELGGQIGTLIPTTNGFSERPFVVKEAYWDQRLFDDHVRFAVGRIDPENLFGGHRLQSANTYFLYKAFSGNPAVAYPGPGFAAAAQVKPVSWFYLTGGVNDANGKATTGNLEGFLEDHEYLLFAEGGVTPKIDGVGDGRYRLAVWHIDEREDAGKPADEGFTLSFDQDVGDRLTAFTRYGHADGGATGVTDSVQGGLAVKHVLGQDHLFGVAAAWSRPKDGTKRDEKAVEVFERFQITETVQFTLGAQVIFEPSNAPDDDVVGVFSARIRFSF